MTSGAQGAGWLSSETARGPASTLASENRPIFSSTVICQAPAISRINYSSKKRRINYSTTYLKPRHIFHLTNMTLWKVIKTHTGTSTPLCAARSHSQQAIAVSMPCSVNIFRGDQHRWCRSWGSQSERKNIERHLNSLLQKKKPIDKMKWGSAVYFW